MHASCQMLMIQAVVALTVYYWAWCARSNCKKHILRHRMACHRTCLIIVSTKCLCHELFRQYFCIKYCIKLLKIQFFKYKVSKAKTFSKEVVEMWEVVLPFSDMKRKLGAMSSSASSLKGTEHNYNISSCQYYLRVDDCGSVWVCLSDFGCIRVRLRTG